MNNKIKELLKKLKQLCCPSSNKENVGDTGNSEKKKKSKQQKSE